MKSNREYRNMEGINIVRGEDAQTVTMTVEGYATVFDKRYTLYADDEIVLSEVIDPRAFESTDMSDVIMQYNHEGRVFARRKNGTLQVEPDSEGLHIQADLGGTELGRQLYEEIRGGYTDKMSFGFTVAEDEWSRSIDDLGRDVHERRILSVGRLYDVSAVSVPANDATSISVRSLSDGVIEQARAERLERERTEMHRRKLLLLAKGGIK